MIVLNISYFKTSRLKLLTYNWKDYIQDRQEWKIIVEKPKTFNY